MLPLTDVVFNTEAHPFPRFQLGKLFHTGWDRKPRPSPDTINQGIGSSDPSHANAGEAQIPDARAAEPGGGETTNTVETSMDYENARIVTKTIVEGAAAAEPTPETAGEMPKTPALDPLPGADGVRDPVTGEQKKVDDAAG